MGTWQQEALLNGHTNAVAGVAVSRDGGYESLHAFHSFFFDKAGFLSFGLISIQLVCDYADTLCLAVGTRLFECGLWTRGSRSLFSMDTPMLCLEL